MDELDEYRERLAEILKERRNKIKKLIADALIDGIPVTILAHTKVTKDAAIGFLRSIIRDIPLEQSVHTQVLVSSEKSADRLCVQFDHLL